MDTKELVLGFFLQAGLPLQEIRAGIYQVHLPKKLAEALEGRTSQGGLRQFTFSPHLAETFSAEYIAKGSHRLHSILSYIQEQGKEIQGILPLSHFKEEEVRKRVQLRANSKFLGSRLYPLSYSREYGFYIWMRVKIQYIASSQKEELREFLISPQRKEVYPLSLPFSLLRLDPSVLKEKTKTLQESYRLLQDTLNQSAKEAPDSWWKTSLLPMAKEEERIARFCGEQEDEKSKALRLSELFARLSPRAYVLPLRVAYLKLPLFHYIFLRMAKKEELFQLDYEPLLPLYRFSVCNNPSNS